MAEHTSAVTSQRRSGSGRWNHAARASSSAIAVFHNGCMAICPVNDAPSGSSIDTCTSKAP
ncbi:hypothetical protein D9M72_380910 [compost metagenome]